MAGQNRPAVFELKGYVIGLKKIGVILSLLIAVMVVGVAVPCSSETGWPFNNAQSDTVTISRAEYERLQKYAKLEYLMQMVDLYYYEEYDEEEMLEYAAYGLMGGVGDMYTRYISKEDMEASMESMLGEYCGIGCLLLANSEDNTITVTRVFKGSPAEKAGIRAQDRIVYVNDVYYTAYEMNDAVDQMRGKAGESVKVTVMRGLETIDFDIVREDIEINYVEYEILEEENLGYVILYDFFAEAADEIDKAYQEFINAGVEGVILDLRSNGGGMVSVAEGIAVLFLPEGVVYSVKDKYGNEQSYSTDSKYYDLPLVVLIDEYSASASEILAGAVRDHKAGTLVGVTSFGKGVIQYEFEIGDGSGVAITMGRYYTPSGECIHEAGITPDVVVELPEEAVTKYGMNNLPRESDTQLQAAIDVLKQSETK